MAQSSSGRSFDSFRERLGAVYAKGLLGAAEGQRQTDRVLAELDSLVDDVLERLAQGLEHLGRELGRLVEEQHTAVRA